MTRSFLDRLRGIHAATIVPMKPGFSIDEVALAAHISHVSAVPGINGLLVNGHARKLPEGLFDRLRRESRIQSGSCA
jgi:hypothetical protein